MVCSHGNNNTAHYNVELLVAMYTRVLLVLSMYIKLVNSYLTGCLSIECGLDGCYLAGSILQQQQGGGHS